MCGRNSGLTDGRPAALDWKVSPRLVLATPARLGGPAGKGSHGGVWGSGAEVAPEGHKEAAPLGSPRRLAGGERPVRSLAASALTPFRIWGALCLLLCLFLLEGAWEPDCPQKAGVSKSPGRRLRTAPAAGPARRPQGHRLRPLCWRKGLAAVPCRRFTQGCRLRSWVHSPPWSGIGTSTDQGWTSGVSSACHFRPLCGQRVFAARMMCFAHSACSLKFLKRRRSN